MEKSWDTELAEHMSDIIGRNCDRLYGRFDLTRDDREIFCCSDFARLNRLSLSAVPTWALPTGVCASKAEHSRGVRYLAKLLVRKPEFASVATDLILAATLHDIGTPPFSHVSEHFQREITGKDHEAYAGDILAHSEIADVVKRQGGNLDYILRLIQGSAEPFSDVLNGTIDIDNLDNTLRYGLSMGILTSKPYEPERLVQAFTQGPDGRIGLRGEYQDDLHAWAECRRIVYEYVYSTENLTSAAMLFRALEFAFHAGELGVDYFRFTDAEAEISLARNSNRQTQELLWHLQNWRFYPSVFRLRTEESSPMLQTLCNHWHGRKVLADALVQELRVPPQQVCVFAGWDRGYKKIHLPILDESGNGSEHTLLGKPQWTIQVFLHPEAGTKAAAVRHVVEGVITGSRLRDSVPVPGSSETAIGF